MTFADESSRSKPSCDFEAAFDAAVANCRLLDRQQARQFIDKGYVVVKAAFPPELASAVRTQAWRELKEKHGVDAADARTWQRRFHGPGGIPGYVRTGGSGCRFLLQKEAPKALQAILDVIGGGQRLPAAGSELAWGDGAVANLGSSLGSGLGSGASGEGLDWQPPQAEQRGWHKDGWHFRHFLDSPEQGLLLVPIFSDILPRSGGTCLATDSIAPVARLLADNPQGFHADSVQGAGYLIPGLVGQCEEFEELVGEVGDLAIVHPFMLHRACVNPSPRPRFIANAALVLREPMRFDRDPNDAGDGHSLVELAVLRQLGVDKFSFRIEGHREAFVPAPFRSEEQKLAERRRLDREMEAMAAKGVVTSAWGPAFGYMSNAESMLAPAR